jgi:hypothetical protein
MSDMMEIDDADFENAHSGFQATCTAPDAPSAQRVHSLLPAAGPTVRSATWLMAAQLNAVARTPDELAAALEQDPRHHRGPMPPCARSAHANTAASPRDCEQYREPGRARPPPPRPDVPGGGRFISRHTPVTPMLHWGYARPGVLTV